MPEGPSIVILKEAALKFRGRKIIDVEGSAKTIDISELVDQKITDIKTWGKHFLICLPKFTIRIHLLMFGSYTIDSRKQAKPRLRLIFANDEEINFYACSVQRIDRPLNEVYDWSADVMNKKFDARKANAKLKAEPSELVCDAILDQDIFAGSGNIFKNEVLYRTRVHPLSKLGALPDAKRRDLVKGVVQYGKDFLKWKKAFVLRKHWEAYTKKVCPRDGNQLTKAYLGKGKRRTFYCEVCQKLYK
ncbi:MAG: DNA-formamidopyrimidine glycosylase family protein [Bacteroidota bacterium]